MVIHLRSIEVLAQHSLAGESDERIIGFLSSTFNSNGQTNNRILIVGSCEKLDALPIRLLTVFDDGLVEMKVNVLIYRQAWGLYSWAES